MSTSVYESIALVTCTAKIGGGFGGLRVPRKTDGNNAAMTNFADVLCFYCVLIKAMVI